MSNEAAGPKARRVCICGSMAFIDDMEALAERLCAAGFLVSTPEREESDLHWETLSLEAAVARKADFLNDYFDEIRGSNIVLIANYEKHDIPGYIGANSLMEAACAHAPGKPVVYLSRIGAQSCQLEALAISAGVLHDDTARLAELID
ncbi:hypothetical protein [Labrenzia sp. CE80]|uniref:hypothetical protein n=1 Tax=Labrenzia sp. CE80 TaxID=1788986 RepID=UPI001AD8DB28|nr:hypothetical protein [Labrenzia sp. CE80]